ncbi:MAG: UDP-N-acetylmuramoyl-L-alanine--D-glutamate ligase [Tannerellaceae bacterium]|jgi:UDP-N-acetylmuramoylalanine--D-glutamate ligase|nr:UDP-N-acetylmuramoyl-L-alanine--D-glutamate ligase [Tannerellaceae bacterium]
MNKHIVIVGAGESGTGAAILAKAKGFEVLVSDASSIKTNYKEMLDARGIRWEEGGHTESEILSADEIIKSPGIPDTIPIIEKARRKQIPVLSEIEFAGRYTDSTMICITGSNGKTTTTMLTYHILKEAGLDVGLAGNVGNSLALQVAESPHAWYVVELSSFQLDNMYDFRAHIAILLNITPDHLDRYDHKMQNYIDSKFRIIRNQTKEDAFIFWNDDPIIAREIIKHKPVANCYPFAETFKEGVRGYVDNKKIVIDTINSLFTMEQDLLALTGTHNLYNSLASGIAAKVVDIHDENIRASLSDFTGVEHRLEKVARVRGVDYINDSKATNVNSCWYALKSMNTRVVLILGGTDKGNNYAEIEELVKQKVRALIFLGIDNTRLHEFFDGKVALIEEACSMEEAVNKAYQLAVKGDSVLLSPCCASFDLFKNYEDRGNQFKMYVRNL